MASFRNLNTASAALLVGMLSLPFSARTHDWWAANRSASQATRFLVNSG
jgi:hypothetical protein